MQYVKSILIILLSLISMALAAQTSPVGIWNTVDDNTGATRSEMELYINANGELEGKIHKLLEEESPETCELCPGDKKNAKLEGMVIMWGLEEDDDQWTGGKILDPENGKTYKCYIELEGRDKLKLRGYIGFAAIGRTQYWYRK